MFPFHGDAGKAYIRLHSHLEPKEVMFPPAAFPQPRSCMQVEDVFIKVARMILNKIEDGTAGSVVLLQRRCHAFGFLGCVVLSIFSRVLTKAKLLLHQEWES